MPERWFITTPPPTSWLYYNHLYHNHIVVNQTSWTEIYEPKRYNKSIALFCASQTNTGILGRFFQFSREMCGISEYVYYSSELNI